MREFMQLHVHMKSAANIKRKESHELAGRRRGRKFKCMMHSHTLT